MPLQIIEPRDKYMMPKHTITHEAVLGHLEMVLKAFAKPDYGKFYIGITGDLDARFAQHQRKRPDFKLMIPIYEEQKILVDNTFDFLEQRAISKFRTGIKHPDGRMLLKCDNGQEGSEPKVTLYILVG